MSFNYRVVKSVNGDGYYISEVHYDIRGKIAGYTESRIAGNDIADLRAELSHMMEALDKPVLEEYVNIRQMPSDKTVVAGD